MEVVNPYNSFNDEYTTTLNEPKQADFIKIKKSFKNETEKLQHLKYLIHLLYNTDYENVYFINGNHSDLRKDNIIINKNHKNRGF